MALVFGAVGALQPAHAQDSCALVWAVASMEVRPELLARLTELRARWLRRQITQFRAAPVGVPKGWRAIALIGSGEEANAYLIESAEGERRVYKKFHFPEFSALEDNVRELKEYGERGIPVARVLEKDLHFMSYTQEYVDGFSVSFLLSDESNTAINGVEREAILEGFLRFQRDVKAAGKISPFPANVILDPKTGRFFVIDPF